jgi:uncharacterized protein (DUF433 family)
MSAAVSNHAEPWRQRLFAPAYHVAEAARYAGLSAQTVSRWHSARSRKTLSLRDRKQALSYVQLIEVAVMSAFRKAGVPLNEIRRTREYFSQEFGSQYPFSQYRFKTDGKELFMDYEQVIGAEGKGMLLQPGKNGQLAWREIIGRLREFEYEHEGYVVRWYLEGRHSPIFIDPRIGFGAPVIKGTPTWILKGRWESGENLDEIAEDFVLQRRDVEQALRFEGVVFDVTRPRSWAN